MNTTILGLPINRFVTFVKPWITIAAAFVVAIVFEKTDVFNALGVDENSASEYVASGITIALVTLLSTIGDIKWLKGHHIELQDGAIAIREEEEALDWETLPPGEIPTTPDVGDAGTP